MKEDNDGCFNECAIARVGCDVLDGDSWQCSYLLLDDTADHSALAHSVVIADSITSRPDNSAHI